MHPFRGTQPSKGLVREVLLARESHEPKRSWNSRAMEPLRERLRKKLNLNRQKQRVGLRPRFVSNGDTPFRRADWTTGIFPSQPSSGRCEKSVAIFGWPEATCFEADTRRAGLSDRKAKIIDMGFQASPQRQNPFARLQQSGRQKDEWCGRLPRQIDHHV